MSTHRGILEKLKRSGLGQVVSFDATANNFERDLSPTANKNEINITERENKLTNYKKKA